MKREKNWETRFRKAQGKTNLNFLRRSIPFLAFVLSMGCTSLRYGPHPGMGIRFNLYLQFLKCDKRGLAVRCDDYHDYREAITVSWLDTRRGWQSEKFPKGVLPRRLVCNEHVKWLLFRCEGSEATWLSWERDLAHWRGCRDVNAELEDFYYAPLPVAPAAAWALYAPSQGAEFVAIRAVANGDFRPLPGIPASLLTEEGNAESLGTTDATGLLVCSKEEMRKKHAAYILLEPTHDYERVAVGVSEVLERTGSFVREVRLAYVMFY